jgi:hypothetical protein
MRRLHVLILCFATAVALGSSPGSARATPAGAATVKVVDCASAIEPVARAATFEARVRAAGGSARMQVRFTLQVRDEGTTSWRRVVADGLDTWLTSDPGVRRYTYEKTVQNLSAPAAYRAVVRFRWLDAAGEVLRESRRTSAACRQPDVRPDLAAERIDVTPGPEPDTRRYAVTVRNDGRTASGPSTVVLRAGDGVFAPLTVPALAPRERRVVTFSGAACAAGQPLEATVDSGDAVDERDEADNSLLATCLP